MYPITKSASFVTNLFVSFLLISSLSLPAFSQGWQWQNPLPQGNDLYSVKFINNTTGWAVGYKGTILYTTNGGTTWIIQTSGTMIDLFSVSFVNMNAGWAVGANGTVLHTTDGGASWVLQTSNITNNLWSVSFENINTGWAVGNNGTNEDALTICCKYKFSDIQRNA